MLWTCMKKVFVFVLFFATVLMSSSAFAEYPRRPITLVVPYGAGGASDLAARTLAASAPGYLGQPLVVVNKTGAGGVTASTYVSRKRPDGYTLLLGRIGSNGITPALNKTIPYDWDSFTFLGMVELNPFVFVVRADSPYKTLKNLLDAIKAAPGTITYSNSGPHGLLTLGSQMLMDQAGLSTDAVTGIPYKGGGNAKTALLGGHVDFLGVNLATALDQIKAGKLRALAVTTPERLPSIPDVPTVRESGFPGLERVIGWSVLLAPKNLPEEVVAKWQDILSNVATDPQWIAQTKALGSVPCVKSPAETEAFIRQQHELYRSFGEKLNLIIR